MKTFACTALFAGLVAVGTGGAFAQEAQRPPRTDMGQQTGQQQGDFDLRFLDMTAMHHEMGLKMAQLAEQKAENEELKAKATKMTQEQREEIQQLDQLRSRLYPDAPKREPMGGMMGGMGSMPGHGTSGEKGAGHEHAGQPQGTTGMEPGRMRSDMMGQMNRLEKLDGAEFDRTFAEMMIRHHQMNVRMVERALEEAKHDEVRELARETLTRQKKDIADLQKFTASPK